MKTFTDTKMIWHPWFRRWRICLQCRRRGFDSWIGKIPWRRKWEPTPVLTWRIHGQRSLAHYRPWGCKELDTTEWLIYINIITTFLYHFFQSQKYAIYLLYPMKMIFSKYSKNHFSLCSVTQIYHESINSWISIHTCWCVHSELHLISLQDLFPGNKFMDFYCQVLITYNEEYVTWFYL